MAISLNNANEHISTCEKYPPLAEHEESEEEVLYSDEKIFAKNP